MSEQSKQPAKGLTANKTPMFTMIGLITLSVHAFGANISSFDSGDINIVNPPPGINAAIADGKTDNTVAINADLAYAQSHGINVYVPPGVFAHTGNINVAGHVMLYGSGQSSVLKNTAPLVSNGSGGTTQNAGTVALSNLWSYSGSNITGVVSDGPSVKNLAIAWNNAIVRGGTPAVQAVGGKDSATGSWPTTNFTISGLFIGNSTTQTTGSGSAGIYTENAANGSIYNNIVYKSLADGINMVDGSNHINVYNNTLQLTGDDYISVVSYAPDTAGICNNINVYNNHGMNQTGGRGFTVVGGNLINITNNTVDESWAAGIYIASESSYNTLAPTYISVIGNSISNANAGAPFWQGAIFVSGRTNYIANEINLINNTVSVHGTVSNPSWDLDIGPYGNTTNVYSSGNMANGVMQPTTTYFPK